MFQGRYKAQIVDDDHYGKDLVTYIHLNPIQRRRNGVLVQLGTWEDLQDFGWSSHYYYCGRRKNDILPLNGRCLNFWKSGSGDGRKEYRQFIKQLVNQGKTPDPVSEIKEGFILGGSAFQKQVKDWLAGKSGQEEEKLRSRWDRADRELEVRKRVRHVSDRRFIIWALQRLGGVRNVDLAREWGYGDGSAIHQIAKRLEQKALHDETLKARMDELRTTLSNV